VSLITAAFVFQNVVSALGLFPLYHDFALSVDGLKHGRVWQLVTFQFLHLQLVDGGIFHLLGNLFMIYVFGRPVESALGPVRFLALYLLSGTLGGLLQITAGCLAPLQFGSAVVGASAGACGLLAAHATLSPRRLLHLFFLPFAIRADLLLALAATGTVAGLFLPSTHVAHCAHLGGIFTGFVLAHRTLPAHGLQPALAKSPLNSRPGADYS
jgi:membrane associated rhomboid family serine protease